MSEYILIRDDKKYAIPEQKKFPLPDADHVRSAIKFFNYVEPKYEKQLARAILRRAKEYNLDLSEMSIGDNNRFKKYLPNELKHHGILGQKWGVRNYQNKDGTLTEAGKKRYKSVSSIGNGISVAEQKQHFIGKALGKLSPKVREEQKKTTISDILVDGKRVGEIQTYIERKGSLNIVWLGVNEKERGKHYAQKAMDYIIKTSKDKGFKELTLEVPGNSPDARHIYEKKGFVAGEQVTSKEDDQVWDGLTKMRKKL